MLVRMPGAAASIAGLPLPGRAPARVAVDAPGPGDGRWTGAPSAAVDPAGGVALAYRVRRGHEERGGTVVLATATDGEAFTTVATLHKDRFGAASLERPALAALPGGGWRLWVSCATPGSKHWWVDVLEAPTLAGLAEATPRMCWAGDVRTAAKDPVIRRDASGWRAWLCCHPLDEPGEEDRMTTALATSADGRAWSWRGTALAPASGTWDARGTRVTAELGGGWLAYDGRASAAEDFRERTGVARVPHAGGTSGHLRETGSPVRGEQEDGSRGAAPVADVRYLEVLALPGGGHRLFYEARLPDGSHELRTELQA